MNRLKLSKLSENCLVHHDLDASLDIYLSDNKPLYDVSRVRQWEKDTLGAQSKPRFDITGNF